MNDWIKESALKGHDISAQGNALGLGCELKIDRELSLIKKQK